MDFVILTLLKQFLGTCERFDVDLLTKLLDIKFYKLRIEIHPRNKNKQTIMKRIEQ